MRFHTIQHPKRNGLFRPSYRRKEGDGIFYFDRNETKAHITIGILGCHPGAGVTQLAISLGTYCASRRRLRTACLELHKRSELARLIPESALADSIHRHALQCSKAPDAADTSKAEFFHFRLHGVDYYPNLAPDAVPRLLNMGYDYLILDLGSLNESAAAEFLRCDRKIVLGSLALWKAWSYEEFFKQFDSFTNLGEGYHYLVQMGTFQNHSVFSRQHSISMQEVPFIKDPFRIEKEHFLFFDGLLSFYSL